MRPLHIKHYVSVFYQKGRGGKGDNARPLARAAKPLKRLKTAMGSYSFGATSACVWRHVRFVWRHVCLGSAATSAMGLRAHSRTPAEPSPGSRPAPDRPLPPERRDFADGVERTARVAVEPVEIETQGPKRNEGRQDRRRRGLQPALRLRELFARQALNSAQAATTPGLARRASNSRALAPWRAATSAGMSVGAAPALNGNWPSMRVSASAIAAGACASAWSRSLPPAAIRAARLQPRALALVGESAKRGKVEIVLRRDLLKPRVQHRLEPGAGQGVCVDRRAKRKRDRMAGRFFRPFARDDAAPPREPQGGEIRVARARERVTDFGVETRERHESVARVPARIERAEPLVAGGGARERRAMPVGLEKRVGASARGARSRRRDERRRDAPVFRLHDVVDPERRAGRHRFEAQARLH